jgi:(1->4)-alpha-D-glucan 1-alpha-D-glucosylmutase
MDIDKNFPTATYRLQFHHGFNFNVCEEIVDYLAQLGVSHIYASPIFKARTGSMHGYDICDHNVINPELGTNEDFLALIKKAHEHELAWIQDIVPNHMAFDIENTMLAHVLENGQESPFSKYFDIDWNHPYENLRGKILVPFLGSTYGASLEAGAIALMFDQKGLFIKCYDKRFPVQPETYEKVFSGCIDNLKKVMEENNPVLIKFIGAILSFKKSGEEVPPDQRMAKTSMARALLTELYAQNTVVREVMHGAISLFNGSAENPEGFDRFDEVHALQFYRFAFWKVACEELNYRRFFTISDLIGMKVELPEVFETEHAMIFKMIEDGAVQGLRIDHIDGLHDPLQYLKDLRSKAPGTYMVCEKILGHGELLPKDWPVQGTTGYDFLNMANAVFVKTSNEKEIDTIYKDFTGNPQAFDDLVIEKKRVIIDKYMAGDIDNCALLLKRVAGKDRAGSDITMYALRRALVEFLSSFPVYRTYISPEIISDEDRSNLDTAIRSAQIRNPALFIELEFIKKFIVQGVDDSGRTQKSQERLIFIMRLQQFTGALMAKGFEDTVLYNYNRLISLNEVGSRPDHFGEETSAFHGFCNERQENRPYSLSATATHDTKKGEDTRARINVLSEIPVEWGKQVKKWQSLNSGVKSRIGGMLVPDPNVEYMLYQALVGSYPVNSDERATYIDRIKEFMLKAVREAKERTTWIKFDVDYEKGIADFISGILDDNPSNKFLPDFIAFQHKIAWFGMFNSLSQTALKLMAPGVPDTYQGTELWDFSLVDPDNRRPIDFAVRIKMIQTIIKMETENLDTLMETLLSTMNTGQIKLYVLYKGLKLRKSKQDIFAKGQYIALSTNGTHQQSIIGFVKKYAGSCIAMIVPRFLTGLVGPNELPLGKRIWGDTAIEMHKDALPALWRNVLTNETFPGAELYLAGDLFSKFPIAILEGSNFS